MSALALALSLLACPAWPSAGRKAAAPERAAVAVPVAIALDARLADPAAAAAHPAIGPAGQAAEQPVGLPAAPVDESVDDSAPETAAAPPAPDAELANPAYSELTATLEDLSRRQAGDAMDAGGAPPAVSPAPLGPAASAPAPRLTRKAYAGVALMSGAYLMYPAVAAVAAAGLPLAAKVALGAGLYLGSWGLFLGGAYIGGREAWTVVTRHWTPRLFLALKRLRRPRP